MFNLKLEKDECAIIANALEEYRNAVADEVADNTSDMEGEEANRFLDSLDNLRRRVCKLAKIKE